MDPSEIPDQKEARPEQASAPKPAEDKGYGCMWAMLAGVAVVVVVLIAAQNNGKALSEREEAIAGACRAAGDTPGEEDACIKRMDESYRGDLTVERTANAAALHVRDVREGR